MANAKILEQKATVVSEIKDKFENAKSVVLFDYRGLSVGEVTELRRKLRENGADYKVYKNTLTKRALDLLNIDMNEYLAGPSAISFGTDELSIVKVLSAIPSRDTLLTQLAAGLMGTVRDLSICLDLYAKEKENN